MKKLVCLLLIAALALGLCGCSFSFSFSSSARYEKANQYSVGSFTYDPAQIDAVEIHWQSGNLYLREAAGNAGRPHAEDPVLQVGLFRLLHGRKAPGC